MINYLTEFSTEARVALPGASTIGLTKFLVGKSAHNAERIEEENGTVRVYLRGGISVMFVAGGWGLFSTDVQKAEEKKASPKRNRGHKAEGVLDGGDGGRKED